jgi:uncharacterized protein (TIRG00374 family)
MAITFVTDLAFLSSPAGAAGCVVNISLLRTNGVSLSVSTTVVGAKQVLDFVFFAVTIPIAAISALVPLAHLVPMVSRSVCVALLVAVLLFVLAFWCGRHYMAGVLHNLVHAIPRFQAGQERIGQFVVELREQVHTIVNGTDKQNVALLMLTALQWFTRCGVLWLVLLEFDYKLPFGFVLVLQAVVLHLAQWTGIPSGGGSADLGLALALGAWASTPAIATVLLLWRFSTLYFPLMVGVLSFFVLTSTLRTNDTIAYDTPS